MNKSHSIAEIKIFYGRKTRFLGIFSKIIEKNQSTYNNGENRKKPDEFRYSFLRPTDEFLYSFS